MPGPSPGRGFVNVLGTCAHSGKNSTQQGIQKVEISEAQRRRPRDLANTREVSAELAEGWKMEGYICLFQIIETKELYSPATKSFQGKPQFSTARTGFLFAFIIIFGTSLMRWFLLNFNLLHVASYLANFSTKNTICLSTNILILTLLPESMLGTRLGNRV